MPWSDRIRRYVQKNEPDKLGTIDQSLIEYKGKEEALLQSLKSKHGDEVPITEDEKEKIRNPPVKTEEELKKAGVIFEAKTGFRDLFANHVVVDDEKRFVTGQNQNAGHETPQKMMEILKNKNE